MVAAATAGAFFGIGFLLLTHPKEEPIAGGGTRDFGAAVGPGRSSLLPRPDNAASPPPETKLPDTTTAAAQPVPSPRGLSARDLPSGYHDTEQSSEQHSTAANAPASATNDASSSQTVPVLGSTAAQAVLIAPARVTHAAGVGRHHREGARKHWAAVSRSGPVGRAPPSVSRPEPAGRWIVQSVSRILASLSPPR
jgi:hypothetical protein